MVLLWAAPTAASAVVLPAAQTLFQPDGTAVDHPRESVLVVPIPVDLPADMRGCAEYGNTVRAGNRGRIRIRIETHRDEQVVATRSYRGKVRDNHYLGCKSLTEPLEEGDVVVFILRYRKFPRMRAADSFVLTVGLVPR